MASERSVQDSTADGGRTASLLSIVVPLFNEAPVLGRFYDRLREVLDRLAVPAEIWLVDDGSRDDTAAIAGALADQDPRVGVISFSRNFGHQMALTAGLDHAQGDVVVCLDGDGQHPPALIPEMLALYQQGYDIVLTRRRSHGETWLKRLTSVGFYKLINALSGTAIEPGAADFRLMSGRAARALSSAREFHRFLRGMVQWIGFRSTMIDFDPAPRLAGETKYTFRKMLRLALHATVSFSTVPLRLSILLGLILVALAAVEAGHAVYLVLSGQHDRLVPGWTSLMLAVLGIGGVQLIMLGVIGQYIGMIFEQVKGRPLYIVRDLMAPKRTALDRAEGGQMAAADRP